MPPDSYLQDRVYTVDQLIQQVQNNPTVRQRFARHFQIPQDRVVSYMRANLVESYIPETRRYTVYCMSPSGRIFAVKQTFHKGTKVFALRNGEPVLKWLCGNPLSKFLPAVQTKTITKKPKTKVAGIIETLVTPAENVDVLVPNEAARRRTCLSFPSVSARRPTSLLSGLGGSGFSPLFLLPAALLFSNNGGGGGGGTTPHVRPRSTARSLRSRSLRWRFTCAGGTAGAGSGRASGGARTTGTKPGLAVVLRQMTERPAILMEQGSYHAH